jgi:hypothetical protein
MKYVATAPVTMLRGAHVRLSDEQLRRRKSLVKPAQEKGWHEVVIPMQFKIGETFEFDGELPKGMVDVVAQPADRASPVAKAAVAKAKD